MSYCRNRLHRTKLEDRLGWIVHPKNEGFLKACPEWDDNMTVDKFGNWSRRVSESWFTALGVSDTCMNPSDATSKTRESLGKYVTGRVHAMQGDPGHLQARKRDVIAVVKNDGCPTDWTTHAYNDTSLPDLHNHRILPYTPDGMINPEHVEVRKRMAWRNPATCALWFMIRRLTPPM